MIQFDDARIQQKMSSLHHDEIEDRVRMLGAQIGVSYMNLLGVSINPDALAQIPEADAKQIEMVGFMLHGTTLSVGAKNPKSPRVQEVAKELEGRGVCGEGIYRFGSELATCL